MSIWARYAATGNVEKIDDGDSAYLVREYQLAFGSEWKVWRGRRKDEPTDD